MGLLPRRLDRQQRGGQPLHHMVAYLVLGVFTVAVCVGYLGERYMGDILLSALTSGNAIDEPPPLLTEQETAAMLTVPRGPRGQRTRTPRAANTSEPPEKSPFCKFLESGRANQLNDTDWGPFDQCNMDLSGEWLRQAGSNCYSCISGRNVCQQPPRIVYHQYLVKLHPKAWHANLLAYMSYLLTQDLEHTELWVWTEDVSRIYTNDTAWFFDAFEKHIKIKVWDHVAALEDSPWQGVAFLGDAKRVRAYMPHPGSYSDVVRLLLMWHHGGFWFDNDVVLFRDLYPLLSVSYQFSMRWVNAHIMFMHARSRLMQRLMDLATVLPLDSPNFKKDVLEDLCEPVGYYPVVAEDYGNTDVYNMCLFRLAKVVNNTGEPDEVLYDMPIGWWDQEWGGCFHSRDPVSDSAWDYIASNYLAMHTRYPKRMQLPKDSPMARALVTLLTFFNKCQTAECVPVHGNTLLAFQALPLPEAEPDEQPAA